MVRTNSMHGFLLAWAYTHIFPHISRVSLACTLDWIKCHLKWVHEFMSAVVPFSQDFCRSCIRTDYLCTYITVSSHNVQWTSHTVWPHECKVITLCLISKLILTIFKSLTWKMHVIISVCMYMSIVDMYTHMYQLSFWNCIHVVHVWCATCIWW